MARDIKVGGWGERVAEAERKSPFMLLSCSDAFICMIPK